MILYASRRLLHALPVLWIIITLTFFMIRMAPGGPFDQERTLSKETQARIQSYYGLDKPWLTQYGIYLKNLLKGDLGPSLKYPAHSVQDIIVAKLPISLELGIWSFTFAVFLGLGLATLASLKLNSLLDIGSMSFALIGICLPNFVIGPLLIYFFAIKLHWFRASGWEYPHDRILPVITLGFFYSAYIARLARNSIADTLGQDYIRTARAKGVCVFQIYTRHVLKNAIQPVVAYAGPSLAALLTGGFIVETIFNIPGLAYFFVTASFNRDYSLILGTVLFYSTALIVFNILADIVLAWLNPKIALDK